MKKPTSSRPGSAPTAEAWLAIWGMYCPECQTRVKDALKRLPGVLEAEVDWKYMGARVAYAPDRVSIAEMVERVAGVQTGASYRFWAASGPEVTGAVQVSWQLRSLVVPSGGE